MKEIVRLVGEDVGWNISCWFNYDLKLYNSTQLHIRQAGVGKLLSDMWEIEDYSWQCWDPKWYPIWDPKNRWDPIWDPKWYLVLGIPFSGSLPKIRGWDGRPPSDFVYGLLSNEPWRVQKSHPIFGIPMHNTAHNREFAHAWACCALPTIICPQLHIPSSWMFDVLVVSHIKYSFYDYHLIEWKYWPRQTSGRWWEIETPTRLTQNCCQIGKRFFSNSYLSILLARRSYGSANKYDKRQHSGT